MAQLHQQISTTKPVVPSFTVTLSPPLYIWPLCFAYGKFLRNPSELCLAPHLREGPPATTFLFYLWRCESRGGRPQAPLFHPHVCEKQIMNVSLCPCCSCQLSCPRIHCSKQKAADSSRQPAHPPPPPPSSLFLSLQTYQQSSSLQSKSRKKNKGKERSHLIGSKQAGVSSQCSDASP